MKKGNYLMIVMMLVIAPMIGIKTVAHPPGDMQLIYDIDTQNLGVTITHYVSNTDTHYIGQVDIKKMEHYIYQSNMKINQQHRPLPIRIT